MLGKNCDDAAISALQAYPHGMQIGGIIISMIRLYSLSINDNGVICCAGKAQDVG